MENYYNPYNYEDNIYMGGSAMEYYRCINNFYLCSNCPYKYSNCQWKRLLCTKSMYTWNNRQQPHIKIPTPEWMTKTDSGKTSIKAPALSDIYKSHVYSPEPIQGYITVVKYVTGIAGKSGTYTITAKMFGAYSTDLERAAKNLIYDERYLRPFIDAIEGNNITRANTIFFYNSGFSPSLKRACSANFLPRGYQICCQYPLVTACLTIEYEVSVNIDPGSVLVPATN